MLRRNKTLISLALKLDNKKFFCADFIKKYFQEKLDKKLADSMEKFDYISLKLSLCLGANPNINAKVGSNYHLITRCARSGDTLLLRTLLDFGGDVFGNQKNGGYQPIHIAATKGHGDIISLLIEYGAQVHDVFELEELKDKKRNPNFPAGWTPLVCACNHNKTDAVVALLNGGANHLDVNESGVSVLDIATKHKNREMIMAIFNSYDEPPVTPR